MPEQVFFIRGPSRSPLTPEPQLIRGSRSRPRRRPRSRSQCIAEHYNFVPDPAPTQCLQVIRSPRPTVARPKRRANSRVYLGAVRGRFTGELRGKYRIFNDAEYRLYTAAGTAPDDDGDGGTPLDTNATLPWTPTDTYAASTEHYLSLSWFNGVIDSGFRPVGSRGESHHILRLSGLVEKGPRPYGPHSWSLHNIGGGVVRIIAHYYESGTYRATSWAIGYEFGGGTPAADAPDATQAIASGGIATLSYDLPAQADGTEVQVRLQTARGTTYSADSTVLTITADDGDPTAPLAVEEWPGALPTLL